LNFAKNYIADKTILLTKRCPKDQDSNEFASQQAKELISQHGVQPSEVVFDCTGVESCVQMSVFVSEKKWRLKEGQLH
jgi:hypothetical protein